mgnify:CR=1 FL=1|jgi:hypothetical protein|tara:strand:+ start:94 stop:318 length:225 start_codon:yes stop_codon:yes gene_type:complete
MLQKDKMLNSFLTHQLLKEKYGYDYKETTVSSALKSKNKIVKAIALIVENLEPPKNLSENELRKQILRFLNETI